MNVTKLYINVFVNCCDDNLPVLMTINHECLNVILLVLKIFTLIKFIGINCKSMFCGFRG